MQVIKNGNQEIAKIWYPSKAGPLNSQYRPSIFILEKKTDTGILLCNTVTGEMVLLSKTEEKIFKALPGSYHNSLDELIMHKFIVPVKYDESNELNSLKKILRINFSDGLINSYNILPTTYCNARCFYCYQSGVDRISMSEEIADKLIAFIDNHSDHKNVSLSWFGGEPLVSRHRINQICRGLTSRNINFASTMTSNCYLFDKDLVSCAKDEWHLKSIQVTLDGTEEVYNRVKSYSAYNLSPYRRVLNNIGLLLEQQINVKIRLNLDNHNAEDLLHLIEELGEAFPGQNNLFVYVSLLKEDVGYSPVHHSENDSSFLLQHGYDLEKEIYRHGLATKRARSLPHLTLSNCMANNPYMIQCAPNGLLGKCEDQIFSNTIGSVEGKTINTKKLSWWCEEEVFDECKTCAFMPLCPHLRNCPLNKHQCEELNRQKMYDAYHKLMEELYLKHNDTNYAIPH